MPQSESGATPVPPAAARELTIKQQRDQRRATKVAALKQQQKKEKRNRVLAIAGGSLAVAAVAGVIIGSVVTSGGGGASATIAGLKTYPEVAATHVTAPVSYAQTPPAGGNHYAQWLNCGVYTQPVPAENAVHDLEHGAVWITYNPATVTGDDLATLQGKVPKTYSVLSPWEGLDTPVVISAWGAQVKLDSVNDPRLAQFVKKFWQSGTAPEKGAPCTGGLDGPGKIS